MKCKYCGEEMIENIYADLGDGIKGINYDCPYNCELVEYYNRMKLLEEEEEVKMKRAVSIVMELFFKALREFDLGFAVTTKGDFVFEDRETGEKLCIIKDDLVEFYDEVQTW